MFIVDEVPLMEDVDEEGYGYYAIRKAEYDDSPETAKKEADQLFYPSVTSGQFVVLYFTDKTCMCQGCILLCHIVCLVFFI
jgi:hypothetical protein